MAARPAALNLTAAFLSNASEMLAAAEAAAAAAGGGSGSGDGSLGLSPAVFSGGAAVFSDGAAEWGGGMGRSSVALRTRRARRWRRSPRPGRAAWSCGRHAPACPL